MAVAVEAAPYVVLDDQYRVVEMSRAARAGVGPVCGENLLDAFPGSRPLFLPYFEEAARTGRVVKFAQYFEGFVAEVTIVPADDTLTVSWQQLCVLDVLTLDGLRASLVQVLETLREREAALRREDARRRLQLVHGGA